MNKEVRKYLIELSRKKPFQTVSYQKLCNDCLLGLDMSNIGDRQKISDILEDISVFEFKNNRYLLSSLVIKVNSDIEGDGFFKLLERFGYGKKAKLKEDLQHIEEMNKCIDYWSDDKNYNEFKDIY
ncbi:hypothetical protein [Flavobacterium oreochromis]|uniref:Uncharacterized protein n=1 Tax=Flavobacterium columnare TaxID=996 RepID=A0A246G702_9FLAO|nr:hypothetical protein [Flavobacterium oreochromis]OWP74034.1 hypothetical protein BWK62_15205 [Flavobacterium oreochromis]